MPAKLPKICLGIAFLLLCCPPLRAQLRPETSPPPEKKPAAKPTKIIVETSPDAEVYLDDVFQGRASSEGRLVIANPNPGEHTLRVTLPGKKNYEGKVTVPAGQEFKVAATLTGLPASLAVETSPGAEVYLDDSYKGRASAQGRLVIEDLEPGSHTLRVTLAGKKEYEQRVSIVAGQTSALTVTLSDLVVTGAVRLNPRDGLLYVWIPPGNFMMGCSPGDTDCSGWEQPSHQVAISRGFWIGQTEVTVAAYKRYTAATGKQMPSPPDFNSAWANDKMPVVRVSWADARDYCAWTGGRLPTEAEWEYAARGGSPEARYGPLDDVAWYQDNSGGHTHEVAQKRPNGFGLYDTLGNVWEWVNDWHDGNYYHASPAQDPTGPTSGSNRVMRGGSWGIAPKDLRVSGRNTFYQANSGGNGSGIRCIANLGAP